MSFEFIFIIILSVVLFLVLVFFTLLFLKLHKQKSTNSVAPTDSKTTLALQTEKDKLIVANQQAQASITKYNEKLMQLEFMDYNKIEQEVKNVIFQKKQKELNLQLNQLEKQSNLTAAHILTTAMQQISEPLVQEVNTTSIKLVDDQMKGRIIGKDGRNKRCFEFLTGTDLIIEKDNSLITISSHNPIRREIAVQLLNDLIKSKSIEPARIETMHTEIVAKFEQTIEDIGQTFIEQKLKIFDLPKELYPYIGRLKYRTSYGQNTLQHIWECTQLASTIAHALKLDTQLAIKCALIHDIGKSVDYEVDQDHVSAGLEIARKFHIDEVLINAIESHHGHTVANNIYSEIVAIVDSVSASRPGARINSYGEYIERVQTLENIVNELDEVNYSYAIRSGRQLRVIVNPAKVSDINMEALANVIKYKLESDDLISGYNIKVVIIKENRYEFESHAKKHVID